jgi:type IV pilus assembly protein PilP
MIAKFWLRLFSIIPLLFLSGCGDGGSTELTEWMASVRKETKVAPPKLIPPKVYEPASYHGQADIDPFNPTKLLVVLARMKAESGSGLKPDMDRRKEALESFPLDSLKMVGTIEKMGVRQALVQSDKTVFQAKAGGYIGQNFGLITKITETEIEIKEIVQDASGEWVERNVKLELQESKK